MNFVLAYRMFVDPLPIGNSPAWGLLLIPLVVLVSVAFKTIKLRDLRKLPRQAATLSVQIFVFMGLAAAVLWLVTWWA
ncbi:MAG: hypothetical protein AAGG38_04990 [Planctomycetota bacterium]